MLAAVLMFALSLARPVADLPRGAVVDEVTCLSAPAQSYALYLPAGYTPDRAWPVIYLFDAGGRGRNAVDRYRDAAEQYGYILAASNNSRNGRPNMDALVNMPADVRVRFHIDPRRVYTGGMSGGARVALGMALDGNIAGVFAASAGYPDAEPRKSLSFALFATTGTEDFNHLEMRKLERALTTAHRLALFEGGHAWPPAPLILDGVEWMEVQAMKARLKDRDEQEIDRLFDKRLASIGVDKTGRLPAGAAPTVRQYDDLRGVVADFQGLRDVSALARQVAAWTRTPGIRTALAEEADEDAREAQMVAAIVAEEERLNFSRQRLDAMSVLLKKWEQLSVAATASSDSPDRRLARRAMAWLNLNTMTEDQEYRDMVREIRSRPAAR